MPPIKENFLRYAEIKKQIKELESELEELQPLVFSDMEEIGPDAKVETELGAFSFMKRKAWKYSETVVEKEKALKDLKKNEEADGTAEFEEKLILLFKEKKV